MTPKRALFAALVLPGGLALAGMGRLEAPARALGAEVGRGLPPVPAPAPPPEPLVAGDEAPPEPDDATVQANAPAKPAPSGSKKKKKPKAAGEAPAGPSVYVSERTILRLAKARAVPAAQPVRATADRPGGLQLLGVSALGVGMQDGDVITEVAGRPIGGEGDIVAIVLAARARQAPAISAVFYRGKVRGTLVVAMPYVQ